MKVEAGPPHIQPSTGVTEPKPLIHSFLMAVKCWQLLHSNETLEKGGHHMGLEVKDKTVGTTWARGQGQSCGHHRV